MFALPQLEFFTKKSFFATIKILLFCTGRKIFCTSNISIKTIRIRTFSFTFFPTCCCFQSCRNRIISLYNVSGCSAQNSGVLQVYRCRSSRRGGLRKVITLTKYLTLPFLTKRYQTAKKLFTLPHLS